MYGDEDETFWPTSDRTRVTKTQPHHSHACAGKALLEAADAYEMAYRDATFAFRIAENPSGYELMLELKATLDDVSFHYGVTAMQLKTAWETATREGVFDQDFEDVPLEDRHRFDLSRFYRLTVDHVRVMAAERQNFHNSRQTPEDESFWRNDQDDPDQWD